MSLPLQLFSWNAWAPWLIRKASFWLFKSRITQRKKDDDNESDQDDQDDQGGDGDDDNNDDDDRHDDDHDDFDTGDDDMNKQKLKHVVPGTNDKNKNNNRSTPAAHPGREALGFVAIDGTIFKVIILSVARWSPDTSLSWSLTGKYRRTISPFTSGRKDWYLCICLYKDIYTLQETNISPKNRILKMIFLFPRWDMLVPWRVYIQRDRYIHIGTYHWPKLLLQVDGNFCPFICKATVFSSPNSSAEHPNKNKAFSFMHQIILKK